MLLIPIVNPLTASIKPLAEQHSVARFCRGLCKTVYSGNSGIFLRIFKIFLYCSGGWFFMVSGNKSSELKIV